jgi:hypothetical protein
MRVLHLPLCKHVQDDEGSQAHLKQEIDKVYNNNKSCNKPWPQYLVPFFLICLPFTLLLPSLFVEPTSSPLLSSWISWKENLKTRNRTWVCKGYYVHSIIVSQRIKICTNQRYCIVIYTCMALHTQKGFCTWLCKCILQILVWITLYMSCIFWGW